jgi:hypothetical protein
MSIAATALTTVNHNLFKNNQIREIIGAYWRPFLNWVDRPLPIQNKITEAFEKIRDLQRPWNLYKGISPHYDICSIDEHVLIKRIIAEAPASQKAFYVLDIGAGKFGWGNALVEFINKDPSIHSDITVHVIGVRAEPTEGEKEKERERVGKCEVYRLGSFKVEEMETEFQKRGLALNGKVCLMVTHWCLRHLVDPVGTFVQAYDLLEPETGLFLGDGFYFLSEYETTKEFGAEHRPDQAVAALLKETGAPFLIAREPCQLSELLKFVLKRPNAQPCALAMEYRNLQPLEWGWGVASKAMVRFYKPNQEALRAKIVCKYLEEEGVPLYGDKALCTFLARTPGLFCSLIGPTKVTCFPLHE